MANRLLGCAATTLLVACLGGCGDGQAGDQESRRPVPSAGGGSNGKVRWAMSGGGWRAHTVDSAFVLAMMDEISASDGARALKTLTAPTRSISCNSGSCWFTSMLAYSEPFRASFTNPPDGMSAADYYWKKDTSKQEGGYMGQFSALNFSDPCPRVSKTSTVLGYLCTWFPQFQGYFALAVIAGNATQSSTLELNWYGIVKEAVFEPFEMDETFPEGLGNLPIDGPRQGWATGKSLVFAGALLTQEAVLNQHTNVNPANIHPKHYYTLRAPAIKGEIAAATPVFLSSTGTSGMKKPNLFSAGQNGTIDLTYTSNSNTSPTTRTTTVRLDHTSGDVPVLAAATVSSSAAAIAASITGVRNLKKNLPSIPVPSAEIAYLLEDLAPAFRLQTQNGQPVFQQVFDPRGVNTIPNQSPTGRTWGTSQTLAPQKMVRAADGGYSDNTAVAYMLRHLQDQPDGQINDFHIVAFSNTSGELVELGGTRAAPDIAALFGLGLKDGYAEMCMGSACVRIMSPQVFKAPDNAETVWKYAATQAPAEKPYASYTKYTVTTVGNPSFGIAAGHRGTLHVLTGQYKYAETAPTSEGTFGEYRLLFDWVREGIKKNWEATKPAVLPGD